MYDTYYFDIEAWERLDDDAVLKRIEAGGETSRHIGTLLPDAEFPFQAGPVNHAAKEQPWPREELLC